jgi:hypothetical protein
MKPRRSLCVGSDSSERCWDAFLSMWQGSSGLMHAFQLNSAKKKYMSKVWSETRLHFFCSYRLFRWRLHNRGKLVVEVEVSSCSPGDQPCAATEGQILDCPLNKN